jgi:hypothetical protein
MFVGEWADAVYPRRTAFRTHASEQFDELESKEMATVYEYSSR